ncbi:hypothetical protein K438DRAFT_1821051 [Mycena galopus ATCC 62051]|nr:hypothetical protein K438DRAFT_1821051 [Mycena galopus ATCC 62051]
MANREPLISVLRVHRQQQQTEEPMQDILRKLEEAAKRASVWSSVLIAFDGADSPLKDVLESSKELAHIDATLLPVEPWNFTVPLNAAVITAQKETRTKKIVFISVEITVIVEELDRMLGLWETDFLVIGKALDPHTFESGGKDRELEVQLTGCYLLFPSSSRAVLVKFPSDGRVAWHKSRMASKNMSAFSHLSALALPSAVVKHLSI